MKRNNSQSFTRKITRGHVVISKSEFAKNEDGTPKLIIHTRFKSGRFEPSLKQESKGLKRKYMVGSPYVKAPSYYNV